MKKSLLLTFGVVCLITAALTSSPVQLSARAADSPAAQKSEGSARKPSVTPFHGKLKAVDVEAKTIEVGTRTFKITSETKITKDGRPATLADAVVGENVGGAYRKADDGSLNVTTVNFGKKADAKE
ncbi:MAG TPA: hypothetical protein GYA07_11670 [Verrucomicrobia bacterium]|nr:hypothetical protein [Verrucomicrobiota bacterium]HOB32048.1 hypothetical protein [Verrucomicrobiota bacterium]HOP97737.1 hypothetical protein [Verrucomicrobiota bacterium]